MEDTKGLCLGGVKVELGWFEQGELINGEVLWEVFGGQAGEVVGHSMGV